MARYFGRIGYSAISQIVKRVREKRKKDPSLDKMITEIEKDL